MLLDHFPDAKHKKVCKDMMEQPLQLWIIVTRVSIAVFATAGGDGRFFRQRIIGTGFWMRAELPIIRHESARFNVVCG